MLGVIGDLVQDVVVWLDDTPRHATDTTAQITLTRGGSAANVAAFAGPHHPTRFMGCVGTDRTGQDLARDLRDHDVEVRLQQRGTTGTIVVIVGPDGERSMLTCRGACARLGPIDPQWLAGVDLLHVTGYSFQDPIGRESVVDAARQVHAAGGRVSVDVSSTGMIQDCGVAAFSQWLIDMGPDVVSANADESRLLTLADGAGPGELARWLDSTVVLNRSGPGPTRVTCGERVLGEVPVEAVMSVRDVTGAGDAFDAGFLVAWAGGADPVEACRCGHDLARRVIGSPGATVAR
ncbi:2-dehydro-3-deoxygluconokinase [Austwickia sp. TVS 96-490-7B]|uniref:carbohydrate kinase family protein n=1 Tax=Austwickia sp. TVS 96-490-7B TaxID=2830843 RepID=UPI001C55EE8F|nr:carbohydrate kinase family protein [Austwickia sp. TVS 96-490-7B]MBW3085506.1 2-dehydro-3-deoxygluconokinase [Austwickia sp. TVS 96-490-7B]